MFDVVEQLLTEMVNKNSRAVLRLLWHRISAKRFRICLKIVDNKFQNNVGRYLHMFLLFYLFPSLYDIFDIIAYVY